MLYLHRVCLKITFHFISVCSWVQLLSELYRGCKYTLGIDLSFFFLITPFNLLQTRCKVLFLILI